MAGDRESVFTLEATPIKFGPGRGRRRRLGAEAARRVARAARDRPGVAAAGHPDRVREAIEAEGIEVVVYDRARVEPTLDSLQDAADFALDAGVDGFVSVGGGSSDRHREGRRPDRLPPRAGDGLRQPADRRAAAAARPAAAAPRDPDDVGHRQRGDHRRRARHPRAARQDGISHRYLRPTQAIVDPELARTLPAEVAAAAGLDVVCHAAESYLSKPYDARERPASPDERPPYQGANPVADVWSPKALEYGGRFLRRAVADPDDLEARGAMMLAATMAGVGFGSAGVHIPHACAYPIAGLKHAYRPPGYPDDHPFVPHGISVIVTAPAAFRFTYDAAPERHERVGGTAGGRAVGRPGPDALPGAARADARRRPPSGSASSATARTTCPRSSRARSAAAAARGGAPRRRAREDLGDILQASLHNW